MLLSMARIQIIGTKRCLTNAVPILQRLGAIQIDTWSETRLPLQRRMTQNSEMIRLRERLAYLTTQVEAILAVLPGLEVAPSYEYDDHHIRSTEWLLDTVETSLAELSPQVQSLTTQRDQLEEKLNSLPRYETTLRQLLPLLPTLIELEHYVVTVIWVERRYQMALEAITQNLEELTDGRCNVISRAVDKDNLAAVLVFPKAQAGAVSTLLGQENISQVRLPTEFADQPLEKALANIRQQLQDIPRQLAEIDAQQKKLAQHWLPRLLMWQALLRDHLAQIDVYTSFGQTDYTFVIEGWVPRRRLAEVETALARGIGDEVVITEVPIRPDEQELVPVAFDNPLFIRPFEPLVGLLALPKYGGLDPTPLMAIFMPIFFGLILGDIAYGAILLVLMIYLRQRLKAPSILRSLAEVLMVGSVWSIVFGFLFGEFFGTLGESFGIHPLWFDRGHNVQALFLLTIGIGAGHVVLGLCLGAWQAMQQHSHHELIEKIAMLASLMALFLLVATLTDFLPDPFFTLAIAALVVGLAVLIYSMRGLGILLAPLELLGVVGNILSYLRLAAIGLSSVYLAQVSNQLAGVFGNLMVGLIIASLFHALNIALGAFSPTIQSLRLHYVEFFSKFYQGGGQPFHPFQRSVVRR